MARRKSGAAAPEQPADPDQHIPDADPESVARTIVLNRLTQRAQTRHELEKALAKREVPDDVARRVLDRMTDVGLVDDRAFARDYVRARRAGRSSSRRALAQELGRKGVADADVKDALAAIDADDDRATAKALVERKWASVARLERNAARRRLVGMLARRGYSPGMAFDVVREVEREQGESGTGLQRDADDAIAAALIADGLG